MTDMEAAEQQSAVRMEQAYERSLSSSVSDDSTVLRRLVILTNIPTPYRIPFFNSLHEALVAHEVGFCVVYCGAREPNRQWHVQLDEQRYPWIILPGLHPAVGSWYPHLNPSVVTTLRRLRPTWLLSGGAWNTPTVLLATSRLFAGAFSRIFWSEGHENAVRHSGGIIASVRRRALRAYDAFAVPNEASESFIRAQVGGDATIMRLPNTVDDRFFSQLRKRGREAVRAQLGMKSDQVLLVCVARLDDLKGTMDLLAAYDRLPRAWKERTMLSLIGDGPLRQAVEERAAQVGEGRVLVLGHLQRDDVGSWLAAADAFVLPTKRDNNPLSVIEAAFAGLPLIVSRVAGNAKELVRDGETGFLIERPDPDGIAAALCRLFENEASWRAMGARSAEIANHGFRRTIVAQHFAEALVRSTGDAMSAR